MNHDERAKALLLRQLRLSEAMKRCGKHLLTGKKYVPETITIKQQEEKPTNVSTLRRKRER